MKHMKSEKNKKAKIFAILLVLVLLISVGYAALSTTLTINGTTILKKQRWSVYFDNVQIKTGSVSGSKVISEPTTSGTTTTDLTWEVSMDTPGEFYEYNVDVVNGGTIDAMIETETNMIVSSALTEDQAKYLDYSIKYVNGADIEQYDKLAAGERKTITVKLLFKNDDSVNPEDLPQTVQNEIRFNYETNYIQADDRAVEKSTSIPEWSIVTDYGNNGLSMGDLIAPTIDGITSERFYVIKKDDTEGTVTLLSQYCIDWETTNAQNSLVGVYNENTGEFPGTISFCASALVSNANVYAESHIKGFVDAYANKLSTAGLTLEDVETVENGTPVVGTKGRLMWGTYSRGEVKELLNSSLTNKSDIVYGQTNAKLNYWLGSPSSSTSTYSVTVVRGWENFVSYYSGDDKNNFAMRPVIKVLQSKI